MTALLSGSNHMLSALPGPFQHSKEYPIHPSIRYGVSVVPCFQRTTHDASTSASPFPKVDALQECSCCSKPKPRFASPQVQFSDFPGTSNISPYQYSIFTLAASRQLGPCYQFLICVRCRALMLACCRLGSGS